MEIEQLREKTKIEVRMKVTLQTVLFATPAFEQLSWNHADITGFATIVIWLLGRKVVQYARIKSQESLESSRRSNDLT